MTFNVRAFNARDSIYRFIQQEDPDIICFQEYYTQEKGLFAASRLHRLLKNTPFRHINSALGNNSSSNYGIATFSSYPVIGKGIIHFENTFNAAIYTDIKIYGDTLRIFNNHLQSIHLRAANYSFLDSLRLRYNEQQMEEILDISHRLKNAFVKRSKQADLISGKIAESPYPVIVCGDFNDTPVSYRGRIFSPGVMRILIKKSGLIWPTHSLKQDGVSGIPIRELLLP